MIVEAPLTYSPEQDAALSYDGGNAYVAAGPGTGKTHLLVGRYLRLLAGGIPAERILVVTFSRRAATELRERIIGAVAADGRPTAGIEIRTFHGLASRLLQGDGARFRTRRLLDDFSRDVLIDAAIGATPMPSLSPQTRASRSFRAEATRLLDDLARAPKAALDRIVQAASPRLNDLIAFRREVTAACDRLGASDLNDLIARATEALGDARSEASMWLAAHRFAHVLVDEFQDTDAVQLTLLESLGATIFAVGDEAQSIYRFRGAKNGIVELAVERLAMQRFALTESRRCPPAVCALAAETPYVGAHAPRSSSMSGAPVDVAAFRTTADEVHAVADRIEAEIDAGTPAGEIAVLLRATRPFGPLLAAELRRRAIPVRESGRDALLSDPRIATVRAAFGVFADPRSDTAWSRFLTATSLGYDPLAVRLNREALRMFRPDGSLAAALSDAGLRSPFISNDDVGATLAQSKERWDAGDLGATVRCLARGLRLVAAVLRDEPPAAVRAASARLRTVCDGLRDAQRALGAIGRRASCSDMIEMMDEHLRSLGVDEGADDRARPAVRILSVHGAKGLEFDLVIIADAVEGGFPQRPRPSTLLAPSDRRVLLDNGVDGAAVTDAADEEEASLWYVAVTRTKRRLFITFAREGLDGEQQQPSRFLGSHAPGQVTPVMRGSLELAALRSGDPQWRERLRAEQWIAASPVLADYAADGAAAFTRLEERPVPAPAHLSVGSVVEWLQCPRRLFYQEFVSLYSEESDALVLGKAIHRVLERFHTQRTDFRTVSDGDAKRWTDELVALRRAVWNDYRFDTVAIGEASAIFADRVLAGYVQTLIERAQTTPFTVEALEREVEVPVGPLRLRGRIDRIDRTPDGERMLVDYKTGTAKEKPFKKLLADAAMTWDANGSIAGRVNHEFNAQLALYARALPDVGAFTYLYLKGTKKARHDIALDTTIVDDPTRVLTGRLLDDVRLHLAEPLAAGQTLAFATTAEKNHCRFCNFRTICPGAGEDDE